MKRIEKVADEAVKLVTLPIRMGIGIIDAVMFHTPDKLEIPYELKRKDNDNGKSEKRS